MALGKWIGEERIIHIWCTLYTPEYNGLEEGYNSTLSEKLRALIQESKADQRLCGEAAYVQLIGTFRQPESLYEGVHRLRNCSEESLLARKCVFLVVKHMFTC